ncbi:Enoyl-[Datura stramonium]|uniref:Enoyl-[acyl-carrier-protein] reductase [NADPH, B-specific] 2, mitochondrial n=1 Tax=Datura stramonium TaxID=4076 RepID=A0ABS8S5Y3_DATST|nr:Enoyl-[acyl-carrier-protein] reductase [NADPH, B-specific] 2, mitochondrial [Datura stramonium]
MLSDCFTFCGGRHKYQLFEEPGEGIGLHVKGMDYKPTPLHLVHAILVSKFLTAVVSVFTACTLPSDIPLLLKVKNCAIWMTNENNTEMNLTHELTERNFSSIYNMPIPINDSDVKEIKGSDAVKILC